MYKAGDWTQDHTYTRQSLYHFLYFYMNFICQTIYKNEQWLNHSDYLLGEMETGQVEQERETSYHTFKIHVNVWNMYMDFLLKFLKFKTDFNKYKAFCLGHFDMGNF